jgi:hypothetical protein
MTKGFSNRVKAGLAVFRAATVLGLVTVAIHAQGTTQPNNLRAVLKSFNQVPSVLAPSSGTFEAQINGDGTISYALTYMNMTSSVLYAHIHFGAGRTNGGIMVFLCGGGPTPVTCPASSGTSPVTVKGTLTAADVSTLPSSSGDSVIPQGIPPGDLAGMIQAIRSGNAYVNVHTMNFPGGEIRGQVIVF